MQRLFLLLGIAVFIVSSCTTDSGFKTTKSGLQYKIISGGSNEKLKSGDLFRIRMSERYEDSLLAQPGENPDQFLRVDSIDYPYTVTEIFKYLAVGDSAVLKFPTDSLLKRGNMPPWMKPKKNLYMMVKIIRKYKNEQEGQPEYDAEMKRVQEVYRVKDSLQTIKANAEFEKIAAEQYADALKTKNGTRVKVIQEGNGAACDSGKVVSIKYEGRLTNGTVFDGNINTKDTLKAKPFEFQLGVYPVIQGWFEGLKLLKKGSQAKFFIPFQSAYGPQQNQAIPAYSNLVFDIEVVDVKDAPKNVNALPSR